MNSKQIAIVVGATSGIGRELALLLAREGYLVGITGRRLILLEELKFQFPDNFIISNFDITDTIEVTKKLNELTTQLGTLDLLILSSGTGDINDNLDFNIEKRTLDVNIIGFTAIADWAINLFQKQKSGHFVAITSIAGLMGGNAHAPAYNATKAFQINYLKGLRKKIITFKMPIYITDIRPGFVDTDMAKGDIKFWIAPAEKVAKQILSAIKNKKKVAYITKRWRIIGVAFKLFSW